MGNLKHLVLKRIGIDTYHENVAYVHRDCPIYRTEGFQALSKLEVHHNGRHILAVLNVVDDCNIVGTEEIGLSEQAFDQLALVEGSKVSIGHAEPPPSMEAVRKKLHGERLGQDDYTAIARDIAANRYSKIEMTAFVVTSGQTGLDRDEILYLTKAMANTGEQVAWDERIVTDKHCIGGIPGNRTSMIVVPIVAAHGLMIPKTSSRAITSPAGTADTMEVLANVEIVPERMREIIHTHRGCLVWGGTANLAPVDDILIAVERPLGMDSQGQMVASILSKKIAAGSTHLVIDIPVGPSAKVRHMRDAMRLRKLFEYVGDRTGLHVEVIITDGRQPIGRGIGPVLETRDIMQVLKNDPEGPVDLREKSLRLAGRVIEFDPDVRGGQGYDIARDILESGRAASKMEQIIASQGKNESPPTAGRLHFDVKAQTPGVVTGINNNLVAHIARLAGAPMDKGAGVDLFKKLGDPVVSGNVLYRVYAEFPPDLRFAKELCARDSGFTIGSPDDIPAYTYGL
ncbi:MAG TPA: thymidine phosphorylase family protein [Mariprofundaceae bacterium]|nr:thymidine phosphorylase family protein [Mariprofundaceae bacterium]